MKAAQCPYCKEEIKARAMICKHCHERLYWSREEVVMAAILERIQTAAKTIVAPSSGKASCTALCHARFHGDKPEDVDALDVCLQRCEAAALTAVAAEKLLRELIVTIGDIVWGGGDIDPISFEKLVRERFSRSSKP